MRFVLLGSSINITVLNNSPLQWFLAVIGALLYAVVLHGQVVPHPYVTLEGTERLVDKMVSDGSIYRADVLLRSLKSTQPSSGSDAIWQQQIRVLTRSNQDILAKRSLQRFEQQRPNSPNLAFAIAERGLKALEQQQWKDAALELRTAADQAWEDWEFRSAPEYRNLGHLSLFWLGVARAQSGLFLEAVQAFNQCVSVDTAGEYADRAAFVIGQLHEQNGNVLEAAQAYAAIRTRYPQGQMAIAARIREAQMYLRNNSPERAIDVLVGIEQTIQIAKKSDSSALKPHVFTKYAEEEVSLLRLSAMLQRGNFSMGLDTARKLLSGSMYSPYRSLVQLYAGYAALHLDSSHAAVELLNGVLMSDTGSQDLTRQQALLYHAVALRKSGKVEEAGEAFADLSAQPDYPYQAQALVELGQGAYVRGDMPGARKVLERAERTSSDASTTERARLLLGAVYVEQQEWERAADSYERAEQLAVASTDQFLKHRDRYLAEARLKRGICLLQQSESHAAIRVLTDYLGNHPNDVHRDEGTFWLAEAMYRNELLKNAQELYEEVVNRYTASIRREEAMYGLAWTYFRRRDFDKSVRMFSKLLEAYPKSKYAADALVRKGDGLYITRNYAEAAKQYGDASRRSPNSDEGLYAGFQAGQALYRAGNLTGATTWLREYASAHKSSKLADDALYLCGWIEFQQGNDAGAIEEFKKLLALYPKGDQAVRALYTMADARYNLGDNQGAIDTYKQIVDQYPTSNLAVDAGKSMQTALIGEGRTEEAVAIADSWINANPTGPVAQEFAWEKANIFYTGRNYKTAADEYQAYLKKYPQGSRSDDALYHLGKSYLTMDDLVQALVAFNDLEVKFASSPFVVLSKLDLADYHRDQARAKKADSLYSVVQSRFATDTPSASRAGFERATIARQLADTIAAIQQYRITADRYAGTEFGDQSRYQLALYYRGRRMPDSARAELLVLIRTSTNAMIVANGLYDLADSYARERRWDDAVVVFERLRQEYAGYEDWYTLGLIGLGSCYEQIGLPDKAKEAYGVVAQLRPDDDYGKTAIARIKRLESRK